MLDIKSPQGFGGDVALGITAFFGQSFEFVGGCAHKTTAINLIKVLGCGAREQAPVINSHETERR